MACEAEMMRFDCCGGVGGFHNSYCQHYDDEITALALDYMASKDKIEKAVGPAFKELAESQKCEHGCTKAHAYRDKEGLMDTCWGPKK